jgi:hypothetical protein
MRLSADTSRTRPDWKVLLMKAVAVVLAILVGVLGCILAAVGGLRLFHWLAARPELVVATQPWSFLITLVLVGLAAVQMVRRRAD